MVNFRVYIFYQIVLKGVGPKHWVFSFSHSTGSQSWSHLRQRQSPAFEELILLPLQRGICGDGEFLSSAPLPTGAGATAALPDLSSEEGAGPDQSPHLSLPSHTMELFPPHPLSLPFPLPVPLEPVTLQLFALGHSS